ncbi:PEP-CTERM sorting domain-containing protein [Aphanothece sacrum]|uniref:Two-component response regulator n=1 Tax=Aphanothece sacrum FPU1 TaxID=1920663 RepID=A0A401IHL9_APHSA|nr:PEP-CTERM sorting domain-containing protein [Aphanothece sacrum]GBF80783.1 two-component response regulator [Aphanothece sacrum FPU1]GBF83278.1 two-component response regulator [Aphanothece sacrum FPU3]
MYDNICKFIVEEFSIDIATWLLGEPVELVELSPKELSLEPIRADSLILRQSKAGHTWTTGTSITFDVATLSTYDGIFLGTPPSVDQNVLINYVNAGGNVYLMAGTGVGGAVGEAANWNTFLNAFGLQFASTYNLIIGNQTISSTHPIFHGVSSLYQNNGNSITDLSLSPAQEVLISSSGQGLYAVYNSGAVPEPLTILGAATAVAFGRGFKRELSKTKKK